MGLIPARTLDQDQHLDNLSHSINRQHHISLQINEELDVHHGLLTELDAEVDATQSRLGRARQKLDHVALGVKNNSRIPSVLPWSIADIVSRLRRGYWRSDIYPPDPHRQAQDMIHTRHAVSTCRSGLSHPTPSTRILPLLRHDYRLLPLFHPFYCLGILMSFYFIYGDTGATFYRNICTVCFIIICITVLLR